MRAAVTNHFSYCSRTLLFSRFVSLLELTFARISPLRTGMIRLKDSAKEPAPDRAEENARNEESARYGDTVGQARERKVCEEEETKAGRGVEIRCTVEQRLDAVLRSCDEERCERIVLVCGAKNLQRRLRFSGQGRRCGERFSVSAWRRRRDREALRGQKDEHKVDCHCQQSYAQCLEYPAKGKRGRRRGCEGQAGTRG